MLLRASRGKEAHYGRDHLQVAIILSTMSLLLLRALRGKEAHDCKDHLQVASMLLILLRAFSSRTFRFSTTTL